MGRLFVFMGKSAAGKDTLYEEIMSRHPEMYPVVPYTTRPIRSGEKDGSQYHFVTVEKMREMEKSGQLVECRCYNTVNGPWYYFTANDGQIDFAKGNYCLISTLEGYEKIRNFYGKEKVVPLYIEVPDMVRIQRSLERESRQDEPCVAEVCRRFLADEQDFSKENLKRAEITRFINNEKMDCAIYQIEEMIIEKKW